MQIDKYLALSKSQLQEEIEKAESKIKNMKTQVRLLKRLQETAKDDSVKPPEYPYGE